MSKMPAKKKSCFQITSVTQAQVAGLGTADDAESLDDPDESRTEDVSSEIYDVSRADYEPACDRSSSEEALNNVGEPEGVSGMAQSSVPQASQMSSNTPVEFRKVGVSASTQGGQHPQGIAVIAQPAPAPTSGAASMLVNASQPAAVTSSAPPPATSTVSCSSRFRVIKLDHGTGEPYRRGRWTCTEFYEKDSEGSVNRTVDSMRHTSVTVDPAADRDSGLGLTGGGSVVSLVTHSSQGLGSLADTSHSSSRMHSVETQQQQIHHQNYSVRQQGVSGSTTHSVLSSVKSTGVPAQATVGVLQATAAQNVLPAGHHDPPQSSIHVQKSPIMPPSAQSSTYLPLQQQQLQQVPGGHHLTSQSSGVMQNQNEYYQKQSHSVSTQGQGSTSAVPIASGGPSVPSQVGDVPGAGVGAGSAGHPASAVLQQQQTVGMGGAGGSKLVGGSALQQPTATQYAAVVQPQPHGHPTSSGVQNVPAITVGSSVPTAVSSASSAAMPNVTTPSLPPGKDSVKSLMPESLQLTTPTVNSLFGIHISVDGEEDRNPSKAFYQAFQSGSRLRDSKAHIDSASGTSVVAIDNKIEQAMDLVKSHLMYAVREEVEVLKEQIKELYERNSVLERENAVLKSLANSEQLSQLSTQSTTSSGTTPSQQGLGQPPPSLQVQPQSHPQLQHHPKPPQLQTQPQLDPSTQLQPNVTSA
ncbi:TSC22 domain family protein 2-like isoform 3-T3 [Pholidichthys leucotaenia]